MLPSRSYGNHERITNIHCIVYYHVLLPGHESFLHHHVTRHLGLLTAIRGTSRFCSECGQHMGWARALGNAMWDLEGFSSRSLSRSFQIFPAKSQIVEASIEARDSQIQCKNMRKLQALSTSKCHCGAIGNRRNRRIRRFTEVEQILTNLLTLKVSALVDFPAEDSFGKLGVFWFEYTLFGSASPCHPTDMSQ